MQGLYSPEEIRHFLFFDIETVIGTDDYDSLSAVMKKQWRRRADSRKLANFVEGEDIDNPDYANLYNNQSAIHPEFGKVVCVSVGMLVDDEDGQTHCKLKSVYGDDEQQLLEAFTVILNKHIPRLPQPERHPKVLCGHNIKGFDVPYLCKRYMIHGLELPNAFKIRGLKPWQMNHLEDTMAAWKFTDFRGSAPLELLTELFGIPSPKDALGGEHVSAAYWERNDLQSIAHYCEQDVLATARLLQRWSGQPDFVSDANVEFSVEAKHQD